MPPRRTLKPLRTLAIGIALIASITQGAGKGLAAPRDVNVLVLNFDPIVPGYGGQRLHSVVGFNDPAVLAAQYAQSVLQSSGGEINYSIVEWRDLDEIPTKIDGFSYTPTQYVQLWQQGGPWHSPDLSNYESILANQGVPPMIDSGTVDEVWMFGGPYFGFFESAMAGPRSFYINGGVYDNVPSSEPFVVMGFSYERQVGEMLHNLGHRAESSISRAFGGWDIVTPDTLWDRYTANVNQTTGGPYGIGSVHYPANAGSDYDYGNSRVVESTAPDWLNYPELENETEQISSAAWGGTHQGYMEYWFEHLPRAEGFHPTAMRDNNWWNYIFDVDAYDQNGWPRGMPRPGPDGHLYLYVDAPGISWDNALAAASFEEFGGYTGHLVTITSEEEMDYIVETAGGREAWIAGSDRGDEGVWRWMAGPEEGDVFYADGVAIGYTGFDGNLPTGGAPEDVLHLFHGQFWNDVGAAYPNNRGYIVEFSVIPGDFDWDGDVDGGDFLAWQRGIGKTVAQASDGDANGDFTVDADDLAVWTSNFGSESGEPELQSVPEPPVGWLCLPALLMVFQRRTA